MRYNPKTETLFNRGENFKVEPGDFRRPEFAMLSDMPWVLTEKVDGMSVVWEIGRDGYLEYGGRTRKTQFTPEQTAFMCNEGAKMVGGSKQIFDAYPSLERLEVYAELFGPSIQGGGALSDTLDCRVFDITANGIYMPWWRFLGTTGLLGMEPVPYLDTRQWQHAAHLTKVGFKSRLGDVLAEGVVARPPVYIYDGQGNRVMWKLKHTDW